MAIPMKAHVIKFIAQSIKNLLGILAGLFTTLIFFTVLPKAWGVPLFWTGNANNPATAGSGTWETSTPSGPVSWSSTPGTTNTPVPWTDGSVAHFQGSFGGTATLGSNISAAGINFDVGANAFAISTNGNTLTIQGVGIVNNSGQTQTITNNGAGGSGTFFLGTSTAGNAAITNNGGTGGVTGGVTGETFFSGTSTAGNAAITNNGGTVSGLAGGEMQFLNTSTAGNAAITNNGGAVSGAGGGLTLFGSTSTAGNATITNSGGAVSGAFGGATQFLNASTAGNATITNSGGSTLFTDTSTAGNATIINNNGALGGLTRFLKSSDGGTARAITDGNGSFDISGLTTAGMGIGSIEGSGNYFLGSKALSAGGNNLSTTVSGVIQDGSSPAGPGGVGGSLTKVGTGTLTLTGANTYTGGTNLNGGILAVNSDSNLGTGLLTFNGGTLEALAAGGGLVSSKPITLNAGGGTFLADTGTTSILSGAIGGVGAWTKTGPGTLTLSAANTYSGGTNLNGGILAVNSDGSLGTGPLSFNGGTLAAGGGLVSSKAITLNAGGGTFLADTGTTSILSGAIGGVGGGAKAGTGALVLTGANTYGGGTTISAGTLQIGNGGTTGSITGKVIDNGVLAFNRSDSVTFSGVISGAGSLVKQGAGSLTLPEKNTYTGATIINAGSLIVDGSIASQQTFVNAGAFLGGHGTIGGNLSNSGIVGPGNSPGTLTVANDYTQNATGTLRIQVGGLAANQHDLLAVNGHVTLGGTLQLVRLGSFNLQPGNQIVFLTAKNGVSGAFNTVQNDFVTGTTVQGVVTSSANAIVLEGTQGSFTQIPGINTPNQSAVGNMLNSAVGNPAAAPLISFLNSQPVANPSNNYNLIAPTQISSLNATAVSVGR